VAVGCCLPPFDKRSDKLGFGMPCLGLTTPFQVVLVLLWLQGVLRGTAAAGRRCPKRPALYSSPRPCVVGPD